MRALLVGLGVVCALDAVALCFHLVYLQWVAHPELTTPLFFRAYWAEIVSMVVFGAGGIWLIEQSEKTR